MDSEIYDRLAHSDVTRSFQAVILGVLLAIPVGAWIVWLAEDRHELLAQKDVATSDIDLLAHGCAQLDHQAGRRMKRSPWSEPTNASPAASLSIRLGGLHRLEIR